MITILRRRVACNIWVATLKIKVTAWPCSKIVSGPLLRYLKSDFETISQKWSPYWDDVSHATFGSLPWRSRSQHDLAAILCLAHNLVISYLKSDFTIFLRNWSPYWHNCCAHQNFVICSQILQLYLTNYFSVSNTYSGSITRFRPALVYNSTILCRNVK